MWVARFSLSLIWNARIDFRFNKIVFKSLEIMWHIICDRHVLWVAFDTRKEFAYHAIESNFSPKTITYFHKTMIEHDRKKHVKYILLIRFFEFNPKSHIFALSNCQITTISIQQIVPVFLLNPIALKYSSLKIAIWKSICMQRATQNHFDLWYLGVSSLRSFGYKNSSS